MCQAPAATFTECPMSLPMRPLLMRPLLMRPLLMR
jgi:hypothetical protein